MRNSLVMVPAGILVVILSALISVYFEVMTMTEFLDKMKMFAVLLVPMTLIIGAFFFSQKPKDQNLPQ